jgi:hypothetical protein
MPTMSGFRHDARRPPVRRIAALRRCGASWPTMTLANSLRTWAASSAALFTTDSPFGGERYRRGERRSTGPSSLGSEARTWRCDRHGRIRTVHSYKITAGGTAFGMCCLVLPRGIQVDAVLTPVRGRWYQCRLLSLKDLSALVLALGSAGAASFALSAKGARGCR